MIIDCAHYQDGHRTDEGPVPWEEAVARISHGGFVWLGLFEPSPDELDQVRDTFGLHPLAVEDAQILHRRPKIETYEGTCCSSSCAPPATTRTQKRLCPARTDPGPE